MNIKFLKFYKFDVTKSKFFIGLTESEILNIKDYKAATLVTEIEYNFDLKHKRYESIEQFVNNYSDTFPSNIWSALYLDKFLIYFLLVLLLYPLFMSLYLLFILLKNYINFFNRAKLLLLEDKEINFKLLYKNYW